MTLYKLIKLACAIVCIFTIAAVLLVTFQGFAWAPATALGLVMAYDVWRKRVSAEVAPSRY